MIPRNTLCLPAIGEGKTPGCHGSRVTAGLGPDVVRVELRPNAVGRRVAVTETNGRRDVTLHNLDRISARGVKPTQYRDVLRIDLQDATSVDFQSGDLASRGTVSLWFRAPAGASNGQPPDVAA